MAVFGRTPPAVESRAAAVEEGVGVEDDVEVRASASAAHGLAGVGAGEELLADLDEGFGAPLGGGQGLVADAVGAFRGEAEGVVDDGAGFDAEGAVQRPGAVEQLGVVHDADLLDGFGSLDERVGVGLPGLHGPSRLRDGQRHERGDQVGFVLDEEVLRRVVDVGPHRADLTGGQVALLPRRGERRRGTRRGETGPGRAWLRRRLMPTRPRSQAMSETEPSSSHTSSGVSCASPAHARAIHTLASAKASATSSASGAVDGTFGAEELVVEDRFHDR